MKLLDKLQRNVAYRVLIRMLEEAFRTPPTNDDRYPEMVMKCLWKLTKQLPANIQNGEVDVLLLLQDIDHFLSYLPPMEWKGRVAQKLAHGDLPFRTIKTILHEAVITLGERIIPLVRSLPNTSQSFVTSYVRVMLSANQLDVSALDEKVQVANVHPVVVPVEKLFDLAALETELGDICSKICSKPNTRAGLAELYELQRRYPQAGEQIDAYLQTLGSFFYKYIKRNLVQLEGELHAGSTSRVSGDLEAHRSRLSQIQSAFGMGGMVVADQGAMTEDAKMAEMGSPVRNRLESPATKSAFKSTLRSPGAASSILTAQGTPVKDSTILSLKERLAKLRHGEQETNSCSSYNRQQQ